jgi:catechol 2,3-dioxygenase-like lactoylglutathione lyase family enzyme
MIDHVDIRVSDRDASLRFYDAVFAVLGKTRIIEADWIDWRDFSIVSDGRPVARNLRIAFSAPSQELVDAFHRAVIEAGSTVDGGFLLDPDGNGVTAVCTSPERKTGGIDHVWLRTRDVAAIRRFYAATGLELGASVSYVAGEPVTEHVHLAFGVATNAAVDAFHRAAIEAGYTDNGAPGERPAYHPGYYGAFVLDPDGHNIEAVNHNRTG